jgi:hypothetical protein
MGSPGVALMLALGVGAGAASPGSPRAEAGRQAQLDCGTSLPCLKDGGAFKAQNIVCWKSGAVWCDLYNFNGLIPGTWGYALFQGFDYTTLVTPDGELSVQASAAQPGTSGQAPPLPTPAVDQVLAELVRHVVVEIPSGLVDMESGPYRFNVVKTSQTSTFALVGNYKYTPSSGGAVAQSKVLALSRIDMSVSTFLPGIGEQQDSDHKQPILNATLATMPNIVFGLERTETKVEKGLSRQKFLQAIRYGLKKAGVLREDAVRAFDGGEITRPAEKALLGTAGDASRLLKRFTTMIVDVKALQDEAVKRQLARFGSDITKLGDDIEIDKTALDDLVFP